MSNSTTLARPPAPASVVLTAADRGPAWITKYGCTPWCVMDHAGKDGDPGWHQGPEEKVINPVPGCQAEPGEGPDELISVRVTTVDSDPEILGIESTLWVYYGGDTLELDVEQARQLHSSMATFLPRLAAAIELLAEARKRDRPADPVARAKFEAERDVEAVKWIASELGAAVVEVDARRKPAAVDGQDIDGWYDAEPTPRLIFPSDKTPAERASAARRIYRELVG
jgi:hypothetical protein